MVGSPGRHYPLFSVTSSCASSPPREKSDVARTSTLREIRGMWSERKRFPTQSFSLLVSEKGPLLFQTGLKGCKFSFSDVKNTVTFVWTCRPEARRTKEKEFVEPVPNDFSRLEGCQSVGV